MPALPRDRPGLREVTRTGLGRAGPYLPAAAVLALWAALIPASGGFFTIDWAPAGLAALAVLATWAVATGRLIPPGGPARLLLGAFAALTAFNALSLLWADAPAIGLEAVALMITVLAFAWILALAPWTPESAAWLIGVWSVGVALVSAIVAVEASGDAELGRYFIDSRWAEPLGYPNGNSALPAMAALPALVLAALPRTHPLLQGLTLAAATFLIELALIPQSRGAIVAFAGAALVTLALVPFRWSLVLRALAVAGAVALASGPLLDLYPSVRDDALASGPLREALQAMAWTSVLAGVAGILLGVAQAQVPVGEGGRRALRLGGIACTVLVVLGLAGFAVAKGDRVEAELSSQWRQLVDPGEQTELEEYRRRRREQRDDTSTSRLLNVSPAKRYDYVRVSLDAFRDHPVAGLGAAAFGERYRVERNFDKQAAFPHNLVLRVLSESGIIGMLLFLAMLGGAAWGIGRRLRDAEPTERAAGAAAVAAGTYFLAHAQFDWLEAYPVMAGPALGLLAVVLVASERRHGVLRDPGAAAAGLRRYATPAGASVAIVLSAIAIAVPYLSLRYRDRAVQSWRAAPEAAYKDLDRAAAVNPLTPVPAMLEGVYAAQLGDLGRSEAAFERALEREDNWLAHLELAMLAAQRRDWDTAITRLEAAEARNPREEALLIAADIIRARKPVDAAALHRELFSQPATTKQLR